MNAVKELHYYSPNYVTGSPKHTLAHAPAHSATRPSAGAGIQGGLHSLPSSWTPAPGSGLSALKAPRAAAQPGAPSWEQSLEASPQGEVRAARPGHSRTPQPPLRRSRACSWSRAQGPGLTFDVQLLRVDQPQHLHVARLALPADTGSVGAVQRPLVHSLAQVDVVPAG